MPPNGRGEPKKVNQTPKLSYGNVEGAQQAPRAPRIIKSAASACESTPIHPQALPLFAPCVLILASAITDLELLRAYMENPVAMLVHRIF